MKKLILQVIDKSKGIADIPEWFHGARLNFAENLLRFKDERIAMYSTGIGIFLLENVRGHFAGNAQLAIESLAPISLHYKTDPLFQNEGAIMKKGNFAHDPSQNYPCR